MTQKFKLDKFKPKANEYGYFSYKFGDVWYSLLSQDNGKADFSTLKPFQEIEGEVIENEKNGKIYKAILVNGFLSEKLQSKVAETKTVEPTKTVSEQQTSGEVVQLLTELNQGMQTLIRTLKEHFNKDLPKEFQELDSKLNEEIPF